MTITVAFASVFTTSALPRASKLLKALPGIVARATGASAALLWRCAAHAVRDTARQRRVEIALPLEGPRVTSVTLISIALLES